MYTSTLNKFTSLSVHTKTAAKLKELAQETGHSTDQIIVYCLNRYSKEVAVKLNLERLIRYQPRCNMYQTFAVRLPQSLYEVGFDLRKSLKLSLSFIFSIAFMAYLEDLLKGLKEASSDSLAYSYNESRYFGEYSCVNGRHLFMYSWEKPPD